ncbi:MAG: hypothetical protein R2865_07030 [Deinococcales bacterium]
MIAGADAHHTRLIEALMLATTSLLSPDWLMAIWPGFINLYLALINTKRLGGMLATESPK